MSQLDLADLAELRRSVRSLLQKNWPDARHVANADLRAMSGRAAEAGWFETTKDDLLQATFAIVDELGRVACPLPVAESYAAIRLFPELRDDIGSTVVRPAVALIQAGSPVVRVEAAPAASHALWVRGDHTIELRAITVREPVRGVPRPAWYNVALGDKALRVNDSIADTTSAVAVLQLAYAARALAAARRAHELSVEHAQLRRQFGQFIGAFGAVQQRIATCQIDVDAAQLLIEQALQLYDQRSAEWLQASQIACAFASKATRRIQLGAHHTLAAFGYFEESEAPWLFRRVHADIALLLHLGDANQAVGKALIHTCISLPPLCVSAVSARFREGLRAVLDAPGAPQGAPGIGPDDDAVVQLLVRHGLLGCDWPAAWGGRGASPEELTILIEELNYRRLPVWQAIGAVMMLAGALFKYGSATQQARFLPLIRQGRLKFCLGYSEPESGSDLASLRTRAEWDGKNWVINGQKLWTSGADYSDYVWLAVKTDQAASPPHAGISIFLVPMQTRGISITQHRALSGEVSCSVSYDHVRVSDESRIGEVNQGWSVIRHALAGERIVLASWAASLHRQLDELLRSLRAGLWAHLGSESHVISMVGELAAEIQATRALTLSSVQKFDDPAIGPLRALEAKVMAGTTAERLAESTLEILGPAALVESSEHPHANDSGFEYYLRLCMMFVIGGGTNDLLRGRIALLLGLPR